MLVTLQAAAEHGNMGCVVLILRTKPEEADLGNALWTAAAHGQDDTLPLLLKAGGHRQLSYMLLHGAGASLKCLQHMCH